MQESLFQCGKCGELTPLIRKTDDLGNGIKHEYAECVECKGKTTIMYTNQTIRGLMAKQRATSQKSMKVALTKRITREVEKLKVEME